MHKPGCLITPSGLGLTKRRVRECNLVVLVRVVLYIVRTFDRDEQSVEILRGYSTDVVELSRLSASFMFARSGSASLGSLPAVIFRHVDRWFRVDGRERMGKGRIGIFELSLLSTQKYRPLSPYLTARPFTISDLL